MEPLRSWHTEDEGVVYYLGNHVLSARGKHVSHVFRSLRDGLWWCAGIHVHVPHRVGGPAMFCAGGALMWWLRGAKHRVDGPCYTNNFNGQEHWKTDGRFHRIEGPAEIWDTGFRDESGRLELAYSWYVDDVPVQGRSWVRRARRLRWLLR